MGQRVIIDANNNVRIIETGPIGPTGLAAAGAEVARVYLAIDPSIGPALEALGMPLPPEELLGFLVGFVTSPAPFTVDQSIAIIGVNAEIDGIYRGTSTGEPDVADEDHVDWEVMVKLGPLPSKVVISETRDTEEIVTVGRFTPGPWLYTKNQETGEWDYQILGGAGPTGAYLLDLRLGGAPIDFGSEFSGSGPTFNPPSAMFSEGSPPMPVGVDLSVLPDDRDTLVVLLPVGKTWLFPTAWPSESRGPWSLNIVFEEYAPSENLAMMGYYISELLSWGFFPTNVNVLVDYHTGWGG